MTFWDLNCRDCGRWFRCDAHDLLRRLRSLGMLRREPQPSWDLIETLAESALPRLTCEHCGTASLQRGERPADEDDWPEARFCSACGQRLDPQRLEVFPSARLCAPCQADEEQGLL